MDVEKQYNKYYRNINFERKQVFSYVNNKYRCKSVIYPGCSIHITPSFYFSHVIYIDKSSLSKQFFSEIEDVYNLIYRYKKNGQKSYIKYINIDFTKKLPLLENNYDCLISIFSGKQIEYCEKYLQSNGIVITTSLFSDDKYLFQSSKYRFEEAFQVKKDKIKNIDDNIKVKTKVSKLKKQSDGFIYEDNETYYIYRKL